jgi:hypothetical protein
MINRIRTRMRQLKEQAELSRMLRHSPPTVRADLWGAAERYVAQRPARGGQRPAIGVDGVPQYPIARQI